MITKETIAEIVLNSVEETNEILENKIAIEDGIKAHLYDWEGYLDSLGLVSLLVSVEQGLSDELDVTLELANMEAMTQEDSPFRTVETLVDYIYQLITQGTAKGA